MLWCSIENPTSPLGRLYQWNRRRPEIGVCIVIVVLGSHGRFCNVFWCEVQWILLGDGVVTYE